MCEPVDIEQIINMLEIAFPNFKPRDVDMTKELYWKTLQDIPSDELKAAVLHCLTESGRAFAPSVGEIRGAVASLRSMSANVPTSYQAWQEVLQQIRYVGSYGTPQFSNPIVEQAARALGWRQLCLSEDVTADRARFIQCYEQLAERAMSQEMLLPEVRGYLEVNGALLPAPMESIRLLTGKMSK